MTTLALSCTIPASLEPELPGIWRYRHTFGFPADLEPLSLGEGDTPLIWAQAFGRQVAFKCEFLNPTGSFKDRGSATLVGFRPLSRRYRGA